MIKIWDQFKAAAGLYEKPSKEVIEEFADKYIRSLFDSNGVTLTYDEFYKINEVLLKSFYKKYGPEHTTAALDFIVEKMHEISMNVIKDEEVKEELNIKYKELKLNVK